MFWLYVILYVISMYLYSRNDVTCELFFTF